MPYACSRGGRERGWVGEREGGGVAFIRAPQVTTQVCIRYCTRDCTRDFPGLLAQRANATLVFLLLLPPPITLRVEYLTSPRGYGTVRLECAGCKCSPLLITASTLRNTSTSSIVDLGIQPMSGFAALQCEVTFTCEVPSFKLISLAMAPLHYAPPGRWGPRQRDDGQRGDGGAHNARDLSYVAVR